MSFFHKGMRAQFNYHPERTRPDAPGAVRQRDDRRPREWDTRPGQARSGRSERRPRRT